MKISTFIIALIMVGFFTAGFGIIMSDIGDDYGRTYNTSQYEGYDNLASIQDDMAEINRTLTNIEQSSGITDLLGGFLASGYNVLKITFNSMNYFTDSAESGFDTLGQYSSVIGTMKVYIISIVFILFAFGIVAVLVGRDI